MLIEGDGIVIRSASAVSTDVDALDACVGLNDVALFAGPFLTGEPGHPELDFDGSGGKPGLADFTELARAFLAGTKGSYCP